MKNQSKNIFFITSNFYLRDYKRFGFELLRKRGYNPKVCDLSFLNNGDLFKEYKSNDFPRSKALFDSVISLPLYPNLSDNEIDYIVATLNDLHTQYSK